MLNGLVSGEVLPDSKKRLPLVSLTGVARGCREIVSEAGAAYRHPLF
jgi:hypothetical protein